MKSAELLKIGKGRVQISVSHNFTSFKRSITLHFTTFWSVSCGVIFPSFDSYVWLPRKKAFLGAMNINNRKGRKIPTCISLVSYLSGEKMMRKYCGCHCGLLFHKYVYTWESISSDILQNVVFFSYICRTSSHHNAWYYMMIILAMYIPCIYNLLINQF